MALCVYDLEEAVHLEKILRVSKIAEEEELEGKHLRKVVKKLLLKRSTSCNYEEQKCRWTASVQRDITARVTRVELF